MIAVYAGRFDPVTNGHLDILRRAARIFEHVVVAVFDAPSDKTLFPTSQRVSMLQTCVQDMPSVSVEPFEGLLTDFVRDRGADAIVRGLRAVDGLLCRVRPSAHVQGHGSGDRAGVSDERSEVRLRPGGPYSRGRSP